MKNQPQTGKFRTVVTNPPDIPFKLMIEALPAIVCFIDNDEMIRYANPFSTELFGYDIVGHAVREVIGVDTYHREHQERVEKTLRGQRLTFEIGLSVRDDQYIYLAVQHIPNVQADGSVNGYLAHAVDISARRRAAAELAESRQRFEDFASTTSDWFWEADKNTHLTVFSSNGERRDDLTGRAVMAELLELLKSHKREGDQKYSSSFEDLIERRPLHDIRILRGQYRNTDHKLSDRDFSVSGKPYNDAKGNYAGYRGTATDITNQMDTERTMRDALERAERATVAKSRFLAAASHDLRQPLQAIRLLNAALNEYLAGDDIALNILRDSERTVAVMDNLLSSLLDLSRLESGAVVPDLQNFYIADLLNRLRTEFSRSAARKNLTLKFIDCRQVVLSDPMMLESILRNLLTNALRYTDSGKILVGCRRRGGFLQISVRDTGIGIPEAQQMQIFDPFFQIGNPDRDTRQGLGLGLSIVAGMARLLDCPIRLQSAPGKGSVFSFDVPLGDPLQARNNMQDIHSPNVSWNLAGTRALLIEDDKPALDALEKLLSMWKMEVLCGTSGADVEQKLRAQQFKPDLIISDYRLEAGETGIDALLRIEGLVDDVPVIFMTGDEFTQVQNALGNSYPHLLHKPVAPAKLRALIRNLMRKHIARSKP